MQQEEEEWRVLIVLMLDIWAEGGAFFILFYGQ